MARSLEKSPARTLSSMVVLSRVAASVDGHSLLRLVHSSISVWEQTRTPGAPQTEAQIGQPILAGIKFFTYLHSGDAIRHCIIKEGAEPRGNWAPGGKRELWQHEPASMDDLEIWFEKGVTDGLPVVPPTRERVERMLAGTTRGRSELVGEVAPNYGRATVEKIAINAVMAGCRPDYLPVVLAAVEAACDPAFNLHGMSTSTHFSAPLIVVKGPIRERIALNCSFGVFGPGVRANATIGRSLRLFMINVGGVRPGETSMSTFGHPGRYTYCIGEPEDASPWLPYHVGRGLRREESAVTVFAGEAPHGISDHASRTARSLAGSIGWSMCALWNIKHFPLYSH